MGASLSPAGVTFRVWAPALRSVDVDLGPSGCVFPLNRERDGVWSATVAEARAGDRYVYVLDGERRRPDPCSRYQPEGPHGPSEIVDGAAFEWHDASRRGLHIQGLVIYQLHVGTATPEGTFDALVGQLPRIKDLGVNAIQLLPVAEFPGERNWGYDGVDLYAVSRVYGGPNALKRLVDAAHAHDLGVIVDVVYNHLGPDGNYLRDFSPDYFTERHHTPWGAAVNYSEPCVRKFVVDNARYWLTEYRADGLRLDATHAIFDDSPVHILSELTSAARQVVGSERGVVLIAETGENEVRYLEAVDDDGGYGLDAVYADDFHHSLRRYLAGDHEGYYARFDGTLEEVARCIDQGWLRGSPVGGQPAWQFLYVIQNHDQIGNRAFGERLHRQIGLQQFAAASALLLFLPYTPMLFMGQEFAASTPFQFFTDHNLELGRLVTEGRRREFQAFSAFADAATRERIPDPQALSTFMDSKLRLGDADAAPGSELVSWYRALLEFRRTDAVMVDQSRERTQAEALTADVLSVRRWRGADERLLVVNFGASPFGIDETWQPMLNSAQPAGLRVAPHSATIFRRSRAT